MAGLIDDVVLYSLIKREATARKAADESFAASIQSNTISLAETVDVIRRNAKVSATAETKLAVQYKDASAAITTLSEVVAGDRASFAQLTTSLSAQVDSLAGDLSSAKATISSVQTAVATNTMASSQIRTTLTARFNQSMAAITDEATVRVTADTALASRTSTLESQVQSPTTGLLARVTTVESAFSSGVDMTAVAARVTTLEAQVQTSTTGLLARMTTVESSYASAATLTAVATRTTNLETSINTVGTGLLARVGTIESSYVNGSTFSALATRTTNLETSVNTPGTGLLARVGTIESSYVDATTHSALATRTTNLETSVNTSGTGLLARMSTVESTKVDATGALAQANSAITASLASGSAGTIGAAVTTESSARAAADGNLSSKYTLKVISGNVVTGMNITSSSGAGTDVSSIIFNAADFKVYNTSTSTGVAPFQIVGGVVRITSSLVLAAADVGGLAATATSSDYSAITGTTRPANNADVTLTALNGGLTINSGTGITLSGTPAIKSNGYVSGTSGWAIKGDGSAEFVSVTIRDSLILLSGGAPTASPPSSNFSTSVSVTLSGTGTIRYTTDGSEVTASSTAYSSSLTLSSSTTLRARCFNGTAISKEVINVYTKISGGALPTFTVTLHGHPSGLYPCTVNGVNASAGVSVTVGDVVTIVAPDPAGGDPFLSWSASWPDTDSIQNTALATTYLLVNKDLNIYANY